MTTIEQNLNLVRDRIASVCAQVQRNPQDVVLLAVSKTFPAEAVRTAYAAAQTVFGENYIQEAVPKIHALRDLPLEWHCIGPIQSNKSRLVAENFDWVHTVDRLKIAQRLSEQRPDNLPPLQLCIQVNIDGGANKAGVAAQDVLALAQSIQTLPRLQLRGLMSIPEPTDDFAAALQVHQQLKALFDTLNRNGLALDTLSMGMSADMEAAIMAGSTMVRVGSAIFGARAVKSPN
jgi:pyridoxal phosphate enzyme (YggS family)